MEHTFLIASEEDAYRWLEMHLSDTEVAPIPKFDHSQWPTLTLVLSGPKFNQSLTPSVMKALIDLQKSLNRAYAKSVYNTTDLNSLSQEEKRELEFEVKVGKGSSILQINMQELVEKVALKAVETMDPVILASTVVGIGLISGGVIAYKAYLNTQLKMKIASIDGEREQAQLETIQFMSTEETKRSELLSRLVGTNKHLQSFANVTEDGKTDFFKGLASTDLIEIDGTKIEPDTVKMIVKNTKRKSENVRLDGNYRILVNDTTDPTAFKVKVKNTEDSAEFTALVQDLSVDNKVIKALQRAEWSREPLDLRINARSLEGEIRDAVIIGTLGDSLN